MQGSENKTYTYADYINKKGQQHQLNQLQFPNLPLNFTHPNTKEITFCNFS